jgi:hypothetical protein
MLVKKHIVEIFIKMSPLANEWFRDTNVFESNSLIDPITASNENAWRRNFTIFMEYRS